MHTFKNYLTGYILSLLLVVTAFALIYIHITSTHEVFSHPFLRAAVITLAVIQALIQLKFFLHLGDKNSRSNRWLMLAALSLILIIVIGSIWIMNHLNYNMTPQQMQQYVNDQSSF